MQGSSQLEAGAARGRRPPQLPFGKRGLLTSRAGPHAAPGRAATAAQTPHLAAAPPRPAPAARPLAASQEISALAGCRSAHITRYFGSVMAPGSSELLILMELLACSVADLVRRRAQTFV